MKKTIFLALATFALSASATAISSDTYRKMTFQEGKQASQIRMIAGSPETTQSDFGNCNNGKRALKETWLYRGDESLRGKAIEVSICDGVVVSVRQQ